MSLEVSNSQARHLLLYLQGLCTTPKSQWTNRDLHKVIKTLNYVQVDSIRWVERAHHMILFARNPHYRPDHITPLLEHHHTLFENWTHDACILPSDYHPYFRHVFRRREQKLAKKFDNWQGEGYRSNQKKLLNRIRQEGGLMSRDVKTKKSDTTMWQWHDGKAALEFLWRTGKLSISERRGFQKVYDLTSRTIPQKFLDPKVSKQDFIDWSCTSALNSLGFASANDIKNFWNFLTPDEVKNWLSKSKAKQVFIKSHNGHGGTKKQFFCRPDIKHLLSTLPPAPSHLRILSPFDPLIRDRQRLSWLFNFDYRIEIYVPEKKRIWGYYVFPILRGTKLIGRIDMKANRKTNILEVKKVWWEQDINPPISLLSRELHRLCQFTNMSDYSIEN